MFVVRRDAANPLVGPDATQAWRAQAAFNPSVLERGEETHMYFRALGAENQVVAPFQTGSTIGLARSTDGGKTFGAAEEVLRPTEAWEAFGMEDPRAVEIEGTTLLTYTALGGFPYTADTIKAAIAISHDGVTFHERHLMTPFNAKAFAFFPRKIKGQYVAYLTAHTDFTQEHPRPVIALARADRLGDFWSDAYWQEWHDHLADHVVSNVRRSDEDHIEIGASPLYTEDGWLLIYSYIQHYYDESRRVFGIEAMLLDHDDPTKVLGRTMPFLTPEEEYEKNGVIPNIVFPSSACIRGDQLEIYYGGADTVCARASVRLPDLLDTLTGRVVLFTRAKENPIISPRPEHGFETKLTFNPTALDLDGSVHIMYRAMDDLNTSTLGWARSEDGIHIDERLPVPIYGPRAKFELKRGIPNGNSGCEDARATVLDDRVYITYTAYDGVHSPSGAISSIPVTDFLAQRFENWSEPKLMTPDAVDDKDVALLPEKIDGKYLLYHRINGRICYDLLDDLNFAERVHEWHDLFGARRGMWDGLKVGIAGPPLKVPGGWLMLYHGVSETSEYRVGAALLDATGRNVVARTTDAIFEPVEEYEKVGEIRNVVFPCGAVIRDDTIYMYYGGADTVVGVATGSLSRILAILS